MWPRRELREERIPLVVRQDQVRSLCGGERTSQCLRTQAPGVSVAIVNERHAEPLREHASIECGAPHVVRKRHARFALARAFRLENPTGATFKFLRIDFERRQDHGWPPSQRTMLIGLRPPVQSPLVRSARRQPAAADPNRVDLPACCGCRSGDSRSRRRSPPFFQLEAYPGSGRVSTRARRRSVAATRACIGVNPALTISSISLCSLYPCQRPITAPLSVPIATVTPPSDNSFTLREPCCRAFLVSCASSLCRIFSWNAGSFTISRSFLKTASASLEERLDEIGGRRFEFEDRQVAGQRGDVGDVPPFEVRDERRVDVLIANAVRHDVEPRVDQTLAWSR